MGTDKVEMRLSGDKAYKFDKNMLTNSESVADDSTGEFKRARGNLNNLLVTYSPGNLLIVGSLPKYLNGNNLEPLDYTGTIAAISKLENDLGVSLQDARIRLIEFSATLEVEKRVKTYFPILAYSKRLNRMLNVNTLYFDNTVKEIKFYDKIREMQSGYCDPKLNMQELKGKNLMRVEATFKRDYLKRFAKKELKSDALTIAQLMHPDVFIMLIKEWENEYLKIEKDNLELFEMDMLDKPHKVIKYLAFLGTQSLGGIEGVFKMIEASKIHSNSPYPGFTSKVKNAVRKVNVSIECTIKNPAIHELDNLIHSEAEQAIQQITSQKK